MFWNWVLSVIFQLSNNPEVFSIYCSLITLSAQFSTGTVLLTNARFPLALCLRKARWVISFLITEETAGFGINNSSKGQAEGQVLSIHDPQIINPGFEGYLPSGSFCSCPCQCPTAWRWSWLWRWQLGGCRRWGRAPQSSHPHPHWWPTHCSRKPARQSMVRQPSASCCSLFPWEYKEILTSALRLIISRFYQCCQPQYDVNFRCQRDSLLHLMHILYTDSWEITSQQGLCHKELWMSWAGK